jgi:nucleotide-binding universal stress UspA family protein
MSDPIVVGTDGSAGADRAVAWAADEAALRGRPLRIVHSVDKGLYELPLFAPGQLAQQVTDAGEEILAAAERQARERQAGIEVGTTLVVQSTPQALQDESRQAFELVVGHRGLGGFASMLLGSTGLRMAAHADSPVVIVRGEDEPRRDGEIVVGLDLRADAAAALAYAFDAASVRGARVRVVHAWEPAAVLADPGIEVAVKDVTEKLRWQLIEAHAPWRKTYPGVEVVEDVVPDHPVTALTDASRNAALVVVGEHDHSRFHIPRLGAISHGVIHHAHSPVAVVRNIRNS